MEPHYPLHVYICDRCFLVQVPELVSPLEIYNEYAYFSSYSDSWLDHARKYSNDMTGKFHLGNSLVAEIASNDGYLLQYFIEKKIPVIGIEPSKNVATFAINEKKIPTEVMFFNRETAFYLREKYGQPDLLVGNNVLAHVPEINDFVEGMKIFLKPGGVITMEFPHLLRLIEGNQFDTIYHEHFSYLSYSTVSAIFRAHNLEIWDVEELPTHGGSLRIYAKHAEDKTKSLTQEPWSCLSGKGKWVSWIWLIIQGLKRMSGKPNVRSLNFSSGRSASKIDGRATGHREREYPSELLRCQNGFYRLHGRQESGKAGEYLPGTLIPIFHPDRIRETRPDYIFILPWNLKEEIMDQLHYVREWGGKFIVPIPELTIY